MNLLHDIQSNLLDENNNLNAILLKLQFLAKKLEDTALENWQIKKIWNIR